MPIPVVFLTFQKHSSQKNTHTQPFIVAGSRTQSLRRKSPYEISLTELENAKSKEQDPYFNLYISMVKMFKRLTLKALNRGRSTTVHQQHRLIFSLFQGLTP